MVNNKGYVYLTAFLLFVCMRPYFVWGVYDAYPPVRVMVLLIISFIFYKYKDSDLRRRYVSLVGLFVVTVLISTLISIGRGIYSIFGIFDIFSKVFLVSILFCKLSFKKDVLNGLTNIYSVLIFISLISWFLAQRGLLPSLGLITSFDAEDRWFIHYPFLVIEQSLFEAIRFNAVFDEPGCVGTIGALLLCLNRYNLKDWRMIIILVSCLFSLSFFFYVISVAYLMIYYVVGKRNIWLAAVLVGFVLIFYNSTKDDEIFSRTIWERAEWDSETRSFRGDNRSTDEADVYYQNRIGTSEYFFGFKDWEHYHKLAEGSSSYKNVVAAYGMLFFTLYVLIFLILCLKNRIGFVPFILYSLVLFANLYQRTGIYVPHIVFFFVVYAEIEGERKRNSVGNRGKSISPSMGVVNNAFPK